VLICEKRSLT